MPEFALPCLYVVELTCCRKELSYCTTPPLLAQNGVSARHLTESLLSFAARHVHKLLEGGHTRYFCVALSITTAFHQRTCCFPAQIIALFRTLLMLFAPQARGVANVCSASPNVSFSRFWDLTPKGWERVVLGRFTWGNYLSLEPRWQ